jgi:undecaprenyl diphosphate synthase
LKRFLKSELDEMMANGIRFKAIGSTEKLPKNVQKLIVETTEKTSFNRDMILCLALSYGGRQEIVHAVKKIAEKVQSGDIEPSEITESHISEALYTAGMPDPDLLIRTSGEFRISNFMLWQIEYTEIYITPTLWPDFKKKEFLQSIKEFQKRDRRFGATPGYDAFSKMDYRY